MIIKVKGYTEVNLPYIQIIKTESTLSIWMWKVLIALDWFKFKPEGSKFFYIGWNND